MNPLKDLHGGNFPIWLKELSDNEVIELIEIVSNDMKRRNNLLKSTDTKSMADMFAELFKQV